jgi:FKBP-type peptidyl-prolyl cis-trans isomerase (trigger factor)
MSSIRMRVSVPYSEFETHIKKAYAKTSLNLNVAGFRKGKIPTKIIDQRVGRNQILHNAITSAIPAFFEKALVEKALFVIGNPNFQVNKYKDGEKLEFEAEVNVRPAIALPNFSKIELRVPSIQIQEIDIETRLQLFLAELASKNISESDLANPQDQVSHEFVKKFSNSESLDELKREIALLLKKEGTIQQGVIARDLLITKLLNDLEIPLPEDLIEKEVMEHLAREPEHDVEAHKIEVENEIRRSLKTDYLLDVISRTNRIEITDSEINDYLVKAAQRFSISPQDLAKQLEKAGQIQSLMAEVARSKALALALSQISIVDSDGHSVQL